MRKKTLAFFQNSALVLFSVICIEILLRVAGYGYNYFHSVQAPSIDLQPDAKTILCIGESTTAWGAENSYPSKLQSKLNQYYGEGKFNVVNEGIAGTNTEIIVKNLERNIKHHRPSIVITMMGVNDIWSLDNPLTFWDNFQLIKLCKLLKNNIKEVLSSNEKNGPSQEQEVVSRTETLPVTEPPAEPRTDQFATLLEEAKTEFSNQNFNKVEEVLTSLSKVGAPNSEAYFLKGIVELEKGNIPKSVGYFHRYVDIQKSYQAANRVGVTYFIKNGGTENATRAAAKKFLEIALKYHPTGWQANKYLGFIAMLEGNSESALKYFITAYDSGLREFDLLTRLSEIYSSKNETDKEEAVLKSGLYEKGDVIWLWLSLLKFYITQNRYEEAEQYFALAEEKFPGNPRLAENKVRFLKAQGKPFEHIEIYNLNNFYDFPTTKANYLKAAEILQQNGVKHVVMQYPLRPIGPMKTILASYKEIVYVDNERVFQDALTKYQYEEIFIDRFGKDFGHSTALGNELISENIIQVLQSEKLLPPP